MDVIPANAKKNPIIMAWVSPEEKLQRRKMVVYAVICLLHKSLKIPVGKSPLILRQMLIMFNTNRLWGFHGWIDPGGPNEKADTVSEDITWEHQGMR